MTTETMTKPEIKQGFYPDAQARKVLSQPFEKCAYIYPDGILVHEYKAAKTGKYQTRIEVYHAYPCEIPIHSRGEDRKSVV
jgi:hypothetical protein